MLKNLFFLFVVFCFSQTFAQEISWVSIEQAEKISAENPNKPFLIDFYTSWCGWCVKMDQSTFKDPEIVKYINQNYIAVKFDAENKSEVFFNGRSYRFISNDGQRGVNSFAYFALRGEMSYPSYALTDNSGKPFKVVKGYMVPNEFLDEIKIQ